MAEQIYGNEKREFSGVSPDMFYHEEDQEGEQLYLDSVLPQAYDPNLEPFDTRGIRPREHLEMDVDGFYGKHANPLQYTYDNSDRYFFPEHLEQVL